MKTGCVHILTLEKFPRAFVSGYGEQFLVEKVVVFNIILLIVFLNGKFLQNYVFLNMPANIAGRAYKIKQYFAFHYVAYIDYLSYQVYVYKGYKCSALGVYINKTGLFKKQQGLSYGSFAHIVQIHQLLLI